MDKPIIIYALEVGAWAVRGSGDELETILALRNNRAFSGVS